MIGIVDGETRLWIAGDLNAHVGKAEAGEEECVGNFGWGTRNREGQELVSMLMRNRLCVAGPSLKSEKNIKYLTEVVCTKQK